MTTVSTRWARARLVAQAMWGVTIQFSACDRGFAGQHIHCCRSGQVPMVEGVREIPSDDERSTCRIRNALGFILDNDAALIIPRVCGKSGQCRLTPSAADNNSSPGALDGPVASDQGQKDGPRH